MGRFGQGQASRAAALRPGADVVFQAAGGAGLGVLQAARERELYAIGVDTNQNDLEPGYVIASDVKNVGTAIEEGIRHDPGRLLQARTGAELRHRAGRRGRGLRRHAASPCRQAMIDQVKAIRQQIIDGTLKVELYGGQDVWQ